MDRLLPRETATSILRQVSSRPRNKFWSAYIQPTDALCFLHCDGILAESVKLAITSIASDGVKRSRGSLVVHDDGTQGLQAFSDLVYQLSTTLQAISVNGSMFLHQDLFRNFKNCASLTSLHFSDMYEDFDNPVDAAVLLEACTGKLQTLVLEGKCFTARIGEAIKKNCSELRFLTLRYRTADHSPSSIWPAVGPTLKHLTISVPEAAPRYPHLDLAIKHSCRQISTNCIHLQSLSLEALSRARFPREAIQLLGERLVVLRMVTSGTAIPLDDLKKVISACPNAIVHLYDEDGPSARTLGCLGDNLGLLKWNIGMSTVLGLESAASAATALREVHLRVLDGASWNFTSWINLLPCVKVLHLLYANRMHLEDDSREMKTLSQGRNSLEEFSCTTSGTISPAFFREFAAASPRMRRVQIEFTDSITYRLDDWTAGQARDSATGFIRSFAVCGRLEELVIVDDFLTDRSEAIADACSSLRFRNADIFVGGVQYAV